MYFQWPDLAAMDKVWLITLGSMSTSTARATGTAQEGKQNWGKCANYLGEMDGLGRIQRPKVIPPTHISHTINGTIQNRFGHALISAEPFIVSKPNLSSRDHRSSKEETT